MPDRRDIVLYQGNTETIDLTVLKADGSPQDLTGGTVNVYFKTAASVADGSATKWSTSTGEVVVLSAVAGTARLTIPEASLATADTFWWRTDLVLSGVTRTVCYGYAKVTDL